MIKSALLSAALLTLPAMAATAPMLSALTKPPVDIGMANVVDNKGQIVGAVQRVEVTPDGKPTEVAILLQDSPDKLVVLQASRVRYDAIGNQIIAEASNAQLKALTAPS